MSLREAGRIDSVAAVVLLPVVLYWYGDRFEPLLVFVPVVISIFSIQRLTSYLLSEGSIGQSSPLSREIFSDDSGVPVAP